MIRAALSVAGRFLKGLPVELWLILGLVAALAFQSHHVGALNHKLAASEANTETWRNAYNAEADNAIRVKGEVAICNASVADYAQRAQDAEKRAAEALSLAQSAAQDRGKAVAYLKAAPAPQHDCAAPQAHNAVRGLL